MNQILGYTWVHYHLQTQLGKSLEMKKGWTWSWPDHEDGFQNMSVDDCGDSKSKRGEFPLESAANNR